ncbi:hypothetical protein CMV_022371 [Castanea mollissima]|uniref:AAA+ ATPase domain-containing protein n=1 Tax=Castanea mollissima TaxID=60419 RepID=A0A8J4VKB7_9ROSI|nr:hypothetical protein CMV_022371 [Castanea mollissima]
MSTPTLIGENTVERVKEEIWACMLNDDVRKIGLYGMGGIGKSTVMEHINNRLLKEKNKFDSVIWVTVSKSLNVIQLQHDIARKLDLDLTKFEDVRERAAKLMAKLEDKNRYVLILDDMWEILALEEVGIPEPNSANGCKLVLTTRLRDVCRGMSCKDIKMELLSKEEARKLFLEKMGYDVFNIPNLKLMAEEVLERCAQLPLAIVTIAASFKLLIDDCEWRDALVKLRKSVLRTNKTDDQVLETLKFSYEQLKGEKLKQCLLHCALFPEDFKIEKQELVEHLIDEGIIERMESRQEEFDNGYTILRKLESACLLEGGNDYYKGEFVKMHDLVRDMVLNVASPQFMVEGHLGLKDFLDEGKWREDLVKASLMYKDISTIPPNVSPRYPNLSTLLLQGNRSLKNVPDSLFEHLYGLKVLDLSYTGIESLPNSVYSLEKLTTLRLRGCGELKHVSSLAKLTTLRKLDLGETGITEVPDGLELLVNLKFLDLNAPKLKVMPPGILRKSLIYSRFDDVDKFSMYIRSLKNRRLASYQIRAGPVKRVWDRYSTLQLQQKRIEHVLSSSSSCTLPLLQIEELELLNLSNLRGLFRIEKAASAWVPSDTFSRLKIIYLSRCSKIKKLFPLGLLLHLHNLEEISVRDCDQVEEIIGEASDEEEEKEEEGMDTTKISLPKLRLLRLWTLPELKTICGNRKVIVCDSIEKICIRNCPKLKRLPLSLHLSNGQPSPPPSLQRIEADGQWWESLEWDCYNTKNALQPFFTHRRFS